LLFDIEIEERNYPKATTPLVVAGGLLSLTDGKEVAMSRLRWEKFVKKFPFLGEFEEGKVRVQRIDSELLHQVGYWSHSEGSLYVSFGGTIYFIALRDGRLLEVPYSGYEHSEYAYSQDRRWEGTSVLEFVATEGIDPSDIVAILQYNRDKQNVPGSEYYDEREYIIHLPPKNPDLLPSELKALEEKVEREVEEEIKKAVGE